MPAHKPSGFDSFSSTPSLSSSPPSAHATSAPSAASSDPTILALAHRIISGEEVTLHLHPDTPSQNTEWTYAPTATYLRRRTNARKRASRRERMGARGIEGSDSGYDDDDGGEGGDDWESARKELQIRMDLMVDHPAVSHARTLFADRMASQPTSRPRSETTLVEGFESEMGSERTRPLRDKSEADTAPSRSDPSYPDSNMDPVSRLPDPEDSLEVVRYPHVAVVIKSGRPFLRHSDPTTNNEYDVAFWQ